MAISNPNLSEETKAKYLKRHFSDNARRRTTELLHIALGYSDIPYYLDNIASHLTDSFSPEHKRAWKKTELFQIIRKCRGGFVLDKSFKPRLRLFQSLLLFLQA